MSTSAVAMPASEAQRQLKQWVREHRVSWELSAWQEWVEHRATTVGFELRLFGRYEAPTAARPDALQPAVVFERLRAIARAALPADQARTLCEVEPFDTSLHLRPESGWVPEVQLTIHLVHRGDYLLPLDEDQKRCAEDVKRALRSLGVQPKSWPRMGALSA